MNEKRLGFAPSPAFYEMEEDFRGCDWPQLFGPQGQWIGDWSQEPGTVWKLLGISATGALEGCWKKNHGGSLLSLSEQQLVDCGPGSCQGGMMDSAWDTARNGIETEAPYPYVARDQTCRFNPSKAVAHTAGHRRVSASESSLESAIFSVGYPISVAVHVGSSFQHYSHG